jgi:hypothetical protein
MADTITRGRRSRAAATPEATPDTRAAAGVIAAAMRKVDVAQIAAASGTARTLTVDRIELGQATVDRLVLQGLSASIHAGTTRLEDVRFLLELRLSVDWWYDFGWLGSDSGTQSLGSMSFGLPLGNVLVPSLQDINLSVPSAVVHDVEAEIRPITGVDLGGARFRNLRIDDTTLPSAGFEVSGLQLGALTLSHVGFPASTSRRLTLGDFMPNRPLTLPGAEVRGIEIPAAQIPVVRSQGSVDIENAQATRRGVSLSFGIFGFTFWVRPVFDIHIGALTLNDVSAAAAIERLGIEGITTPVTIRGVTLGELQLEQLTINQISL